MNPYQRKTKGTNFYGLKNGMVFKKHHQGKDYEVKVVSTGDGFEFLLGDKKFNSLTAAAKHVVGIHCSISGPLFWGARTESWQS